MITEKQKITKLVVPFYEARNELEKDEWGSSDDAWEECSCGSKIFYVCTNYNDKAKTIDMDRVCAECGSFEGGYSIKKLTKEESKVIEKTIIDVENRRSIFKDFQFGIGKIIMRKIKKKKRKKKKKRG